MRGAESRPLLTPLLPPVPPPPVLCVVSQLSGEESLLRVRVHNKTLLSNSLIGTARLPLDYLVILHSSVTNASQQSPSSSNLDSHTFWVEIGRENRQAVPAGAVLLSVDSFTFNREEDREALRAAMSAKVDRRISLPSILHRDDASENSQGEGERERKDRIHSHPPEPTFTAPPSTPPPSPTATPSATSSSPPTPQHSDKKPNTTVTLSSPARPPLQSYSSSSQSSSSTPQLPPGQGPSSSPHSRQSSLPAPNPKLRLFGGPLSNGIARSRSSVPVVVYVCIQYLIYHGLQTVGLFRISPSSVMVEAIKASFENGDSVNISDPPRHCRCTEELLQRAHRTSHTLHRIHAIHRRPLTPG